MDVQALFDAMSGLARASRSNYHLTLGFLLDAIQGGKSNLPIRYEDGGHPGRPHSYRGYYADLAFEDGKPTTLGAFRKAARKALGATFEGYKGGDFTMNGDTPLWRSPYGINSKVAIVGITVGDDAVILHTKKLEG